MTFVTPNSSVEFHIESKETFLLQLKFRTYQQDGMLAYAEASNAYLYILLRSGHLEIELAIDGCDPTSFKVERDISDGQWHNVMCSVSKTELLFMVDQGQEIRLADPNLQRLGTFKQLLLIGQAPARYPWPGFIGCVDDLRIDGKLVWPEKTSNVVSGVCAASDNCFPNPCLHGGRCDDKGYGFLCMCTGTFHRGARCEEPLYKRTCEEYGQLGLSKDALCSMDPDGMGPLSSFTALCNMTTEEPATVIGHNKIGKQSVSQGGWHYDGAFHHVITYGANQDAISAVIDNSRACRQHVSYMCFKSKLLNYGGDSVVQWRSPHTMGLSETYWGGAPRGSHMCACGVNHTCDDPTKICNCDIGDKKWREDAGLSAKMNILSCVRVCVWPCTCVMHFQRKDVFQGYKVEPPVSNHP